MTHKTIRRSREQRNEIAIAGASAAMRQLESVGLPLTDGGQYAGLFQGFYEALIDAMDGTVVAEGERPERLHRGSRAAGPPMAGGTEMAA